MKSSRSHLLGRASGRLAATAAVIVALVLSMFGTIGGTSSAWAADGATATATLSASSALSGAPVTVTLSVSCSNPGGCAGTTVRFPTATVTGNGSRTDFNAWVAAGTCAGMAKTTGQLSFSLGNLPTGSSQCAFTITPPQFLTYDNAQTILTPTISGTNFTSATG